MRVYCCNILYRCWQEKGYLLIYITGRPLIQKEHILTFLGAHRFPLGLVACADSLSPDSQTFKTMYLARLIKEVRAKSDCYTPPPPPPPHTHTHTHTHTRTLAAHLFNHGFLSSLFMMINTNVIKFFRRIYLVRER